ncbi:hypothetical protein Ahu01nite_077110 [Winogradskya humida]|uniref:Uncharacterized protein n=1 Tax=Winogradskya humida TaxID=113566 RepID=A0ABQ4A1M3_9ACTN|nr:hypothetical protein Ahu01nite_077110 [Actinoplanes humidus]
MVTDGQRAAGRIRTSSPRSIRRTFELVVVVGRGIGEVAVVGAHLRDRGFGAEPDVVEQAKRAFDVVRHSLSSVDLKAQLTERQIRPLVRPTPSQEAPRAARSTYPRRFDGWA